MKTKQQPSYYGLTQNKCQPTDIDGIKIIGNLLILLEVKKGYIDSKYGQRLLLERISRKWINNGGRCIILYMRHHTSSDVNIEPTDLRLYEWHLDNVKQPLKMGNRDLVYIMNKIKSIYE